MVDTPRPANQLDNQGKQGKVPSKDTKGAKGAKGGKGKDAKPKPKPKPKPAKPAKPAKGGPSFFEKNKVPMFFVAVAGVLVLWFRRTSRSSQSSGQNYQGSTQ